jgi:hypothetical protein
LSGEESLPVAPPNGRLSFRAMRNGAPLGAHELKFERLGERLTVDIIAEYTLKLAFVTLFRYRLQGREVWNGGLLESARFSTDNNGAKDFMRLQRGQDGFAVEGSRGKPYSAPLAWRPATHWNVQQLASTMINPQDGAPLTYTVRRLGLSRVVDAGGARKDAKHYSLLGESPLELWYDADETWVGLRAKATDGSLVTYLSGI